MSLKEASMHFVQRLQQKRHKSSSALCEDMYFFKWPLHGNLKIIVDNDRKRFPKATCFASATIWL